MNHREKSVLVVENGSVHLKRLAGSTLLSDLSEQRAVDYMSTRQKEGASARTINMELQVFSRAIGYTWNALRPGPKKLEENHDVGRALEPEEEKAIMEAAERNSSKLIYPFLFALAWTGIRSDEARTLRWSQVDFEAGEITVGKAKTEAGRGRRIPMSANLKATLQQPASWYVLKLA